MTFKCCQLRIRVLNFFEIKRQTNSSQSSLNICANYPYWRSIFGRLLKTKGLAMPKASPSFKIGSSKAKKSPRPKMQNRQENPNPQNLMKQKIEVLKSPIKSESDKKEYKVIRLKNGLRALLISDLNSLKEKCGEVRSMLHECDEVTNDGQWMDGVHSGSDSESEGSSLEESEADESVDEEETDENDEDVEDNDGRRHANRQMDSGDEKMAACALTTGVGSFSDPEHIQGLAHFVEHMLFMGSKKFPKENDFDSFIKKKGGSDNAQTDCENTTFHFEIQENFLEKGMDKFSQFFVAPLMRQEAMQREREAIESEFALALPSDEHRHDQLLGGLLPVGHPARTFMWGNLKSLSAPVGPEDPALHAAAHEFRKRHYSAHRMTVAVQARLPLDTLEKYVVSTFGLIPNNGQPADDFSMHAFKPEDITKEFNSIYYIKPISQVTELNLTWCMRSFLEEYKSKPHQYVSWILGHEGADSLLSHLRKKVWALEIYTGNSESGIDHTSLLCFFTVTIVLTQEGLKHWREVLDDVFAYINMLRKECPNERIFKEIQSIEEMNFRFAEECQPCDNVENLAENMQFYPPEHYLTGADLFYEYNPDGIKYVLDCMVPEKVNIMVLSQQHEEPPEYDQIEEWFGTEYKKTEIPEADLKRWKEIAPYEEFRLPEPNIFITDNFDLIPLPSKLTELVGTEDKPSEPAAVPAPVAEKKKKASPKAKAGKKQIQKIEIPEVSDEEKKALQMKAEAQKLRIDTIRSILDAPPSLLINDGLLELWYKPDYKFRLPNAFINIHLISPIVMTSCKDSTLLDIWCQILKQMLTEKLYAAGMARLYHEMYPYEKGLSIRLWGFSQKLPILADVITKTMKDYRLVLTEPLYLAIRDIQSKRYHNSIYKPSQLVKFALTLDTYWTNMQKLEALEEIKYQDVEAIGERFLDKLLVQMLVQGNLMKEDALALGKTMRNNLDWKLLKEEEKPKVRVLQIPAGSKFCRVIGLNKDNSNSNITNYYQSGAYSLRESCIIETIVMLMEEPLFDTLRTKEQLGYNVFCMLRSTFGVLGLSVTVNTQVEKYSADHIDERIESFLASFGEDVKKLPLKTFEQTRRALIKMKRCVDVELKDEFSRNWAEISSAEYSFNRLQEEIECLKTITIEEIQQWYDEHSMSGSKKNFKKLSVQVIGNKKGESPEPIAPKISDCAKEMSKANPTILQLNLIPGCTKPVSDEPAPEFILSVEEFRAPLEMYPEVKHPLPGQTPLI